MATSKVERYSVYNDGSSTTISTSSLFILSAVASKGNADTVEQNKIIEQPDDITFEQLFKSYVYQIFQLIAQTNLICRATASTKKNNFFPGQSAESQDIL